MRPFLQGSIFLFRKLIRYSCSFGIIVLLVFLLPRMMPGDPVANLVGEDIYLTDETKETLRAALGLDSPLHEQFVLYSIHLLHLDLGYSYHMHGAVSDILADRGWTLFIHRYIYHNRYVGFIWSTCRFEHET